MSADNTLSLDGMNVHFYTIQFGRNFHTNKYARNITKRWEKLNLKIKWIEMVEKYLHRLHSP